jgi:hypothetical protein
LLSEFTIKNNQGFFCYAASVWAKFRRSIDRIAFVVSIDEDRQAESR